MASINQSESTDYSPDELVLLDLELLVDDARLLGELHPRLHALGEVLHDLGHLLRDLLALFHEARDPVLHLEQRERVVQQLRRQRLRELDLANLYGQRGRELHSFL